MLIFLCYNLSSRYMYLARLNVTCIEKRALRDMLMLHVACQDKATYCLRLYITFQEAFAGMVAGDFLFFFFFILLSMG